MGFFTAPASGPFTRAAPSGLRGRVRDALPVDRSLVGRDCEGSEFERVGFVVVVVLGFESTELLRLGGGDSADSDFVERMLEFRESFMGETFGGRKENSFPFYRKDR
ncbi:hypothetical protein D7X12_06685 [Corallococcus sicarius]|uniref:Uncharacterized protein n=1 Tax=Corallococcus sicarius TaxID=2316726 RepID=A0A3A8NRA8_9BACT|nr:hypothetical protein D7X12_06685 [Corallococcus sicarius]